MRWFLWAVLPLFFLGCLEETKTRYVCPDASIAYAPEDCFSKPSATQVPSAFTPLPQPSFSLPAKPTILPPSSQALGDLETQIMEEINAVRVLHNLPELQWNERAASAARKYMKALAEQGRFAHQGSTGEDVHDRLFAEGLVHFVANENLAQFPFEGKLPNASVVVNGWLKSPGHRSNILDVDRLYDHAGVGVYCAEEYCNFAYTAVSLSRSTTIDLDKEVFTFIYLNDPGYGFERTVKMRFQIANATGPLDVYLLPDSQSFEKAKTLNAQEFQLRRFDYFKAFESVSGIDEQVNASVGVGVMVINKDSKTNVFVVKTSLEE